MMYPFTNNSTLNPAAMMNFAAATSRRTPSYGNGNMIHSNKIPRGAAPGACLVIRPNDVLCGRGKTSFNHSGNRRFRHIISQAIDEYRAASSKWEKSLVAARLVSVIHASGGRFLKQKKDNEDEWYELSSSESKSKVSHAIRDAIAATKPSRRPSTQDKSMKTAAAVVSSSSIPSCTSTPMDDSSSATAATAPMDDSMTDASDQSANSSSSFVRPRYRGTWSSNSLVSLTDDSDEKEPAVAPKMPKIKPDLAPSKKLMRNECWSSSSEEDDSYNDDFASYIHRVLGPAHR